MQIDGGHDIAGISMPCGIIKFDDDGVCTTPDTRAKLLSSIAGGGFTHIIFMSHGWNTDFGDAIGQYRAFLTEVEKLPAASGGGFKPVFVGVSWPSVWFPLDDGPSLAGSETDPAAGVVAAVASGLAADELSILLRQEKLTRSQVERAIDLGLPGLNASADEVPEDKALSRDEVVRAVAHMQAAEAPLIVPDVPHAVGEAGTPSEMQIAGGLEMLNPKHILRLFSVYKMKDRAGKVGSKGVAKLLADLRALNMPVHLVGHSFGAKVMASALAAQGDQGPKAASALLLQPAFSHLGFATEVKGREGPGGYRSVVEEQKVSGPIFTTFSNGDTPLHDLFHLALRRPADLGDIRIAGDEPPSVYAALGGYGPRKSGEELVDPIRKPGDAYGDLLHKRLVGLDGSGKVDYPQPQNRKRISSHGDVANPYTAWALLQQMGR